VTLRLPIKEKGKKRAREEKKRVWGGGGGGKETKKGQERGIFQDGPSAARSWEGHVIRQGIAEGKNASGGDVF